jgi:hypothetical protein
MQDEIIRNVAHLMTAQTAAYTSLGSLTTQLVGALTRCEPNQIESIARAGETEMFRMRARLLEITSALTEFTEFRSKQTEPVSLDPASRENFEIAVADLLAIARDFDKLAGRATSLAVSGSTFAAAGIQNCGVPPTTYNAPVLKYQKGGIR